MTTVASPAALRGTHRAATRHGLLLPPITDCAEWAWWISAKTCLVPAVALYPANRLHRAAVCLMASHLVPAWASYGYTVHLVPAAGFAPAADTDALYTAVADTAAAAIDPAALLAALDDQGPP